MVYQCHLILMWIQVFYQDINRAHEQDDGCFADTECEEPPKKRARTMCGNTVNKNEENKSTLENLTISKCGDNLFIKEF